MRTPTVLLTGLALTLAAPTASHAAKKAPPKVCNLVTDKTGDGHNDYVDIVSADIATGKTELVAVLRVKTTTDPTDLLSPLDWYHWSFGATLNGTDYNFERDQKWMHGTPTNGVGVGTTSPPFTFVKTATTYEWHVKRSDLPSLTKKAGQKFVQIHGVSWYRGSSDDKAASTPATKSYTDKAPSCVSAK